MKYILYPLTMVCAYGALFVLQKVGWPERYISYTIGIAVALFVTLMEWRWPYRKEWQPTSKDIINDILFMIFVQIVLPVFLTFSVHQFLTRYQLSFELWPRHWPLLVQTALMLVGAEFFRYFLHRLAHSWIPLWRLHAVHHAPDKVYWMNTGRFHPLEKSIQFCFDALPFLILGVSQEVLASYFVFYSVNGFFQHCNIDVRLGILNYFVSGPELHRWHHSKRMKEANNNFGNNLILWDIIFGTRFLPKERSVERLGISDKGYDRNFLELMKAPFAKVE